MVTVEQTRGVIIKQDLPRNEQLIRAGPRATSTIKVHSYP
jgi:hypothetical protein